MSLDTNTENKGVNPLSGKKDTGNVIQFGFFLLLSFIVWYLGALGENFSANVKYPISFENIPESFDKGNIPQRVTLNLEGTGFSMMKFKMSGKKSPYVVDFNQTHYSKVSLGHAGDYFILSSRLVAPMSEQLKPSCKIVSIKPDTLFFDRMPEPQTP